MLDPKEIESFQLETGVAVWFLGGPSLAIRSSRSLLYLDFFTGPAPQGLVKAIPEIIDPGALRRASIALSTHQHEDHCDKLSLSHLHQNTSSLFLGPPSCNELYRQWGFDLARTRIIAPDETFAKDDYTVHALPSNDEYGPDAVSFLLEVDGVRIFDGGDTYYFPEMADLGKKWNIDIAFLNYAKNPPDIRFYMEEDAILQAARDLNARITVIKHFDLWVSALIDPTSVVERLRAEGLDTRTMELGERLEYPGSSSAG